MVTFRDFLGKSPELLFRLKTTIFSELSFFFQQGNQTLAALKLVTDVWFICDMMLNFRTGVFRYHIRKVLEMDPTEIRRLYIKGWFFIDLIATFPFDVFFDLILLGSTEVRERFPGSILADKIIHQKLSISF